MEASTACILSLLSAEPRRVNKLGLNTGHPSSQMAKTKYLSSLRSDSSQPDHAANSFLKLVTDPTKWL